MNLYRLYIHNNSFSLFKRCLYIDYPLVAAAAETQLFVFQGFYEASVHKHIYLLKQSLLCGVLQKFFKAITGVAPYILCTVLSYSFGKLRKAMWLEHGVSSCECHIGKGVVEYYFQNFLYLNRVAVFNIPRLWVVTSGAVMGTTRRIDRGTKPRSINCCIFQYLN